MVQILRSHPFAKCAKGWGTPFRAYVEKKQILHCAQDDICLLLPLIAAAVVVAAAGLAGPAVGLAAAGPGRGVVPAASDGW